MKGIESINPRRFKKHLKNKPFAPVVCLTIFLHFCSGWVDIYKIAYKDQPPWLPYFYNIFILPLIIVNALIYDLWPVATKLNPKNFQLHEQWLDILT